MPSIFDLLKDPDALMKQVNRMSDAASNIKAEGQAGGKMVCVTINGRFEILDIKIDPICIDPKDPKMLEDLVCDAFNDATNKLRSLIANIPAIPFGPQDGDS